MFKKIIFSFFIAVNGLNSALAWTVAPTDVSFTNSDGLIIPGKLFAPTTPPAPGTTYPAVLMLHGCAGVYNSQAQISNIYREWADRLTGAGYVALLVDSFTPRNTGNQCGNGAGTGVSEIFDRPKDVNAAYQYLATQMPSINAAKIGVMGWSHGGSTVMSTLATTNPVNVTLANPKASTKPFKVGLVFYAGCGLSDSRCGIQSNGNPASCWGGISKSKWDAYSPTVFFHGSADTTTSPSFCSSRVSKGAAISGGGTLSITLYDNAIHSFDDPGVGGSACFNTTSTPNSCAKTQSDTATMATLKLYLK